MRVHVMALLMAGCLLAAVCLAGGIYWAGRAILGVRDVPVVVDRAEASVNFLGPSDSMAVRADGREQFVDPVARTWREAAKLVMGMEGWRIAEVVDEFHRRAEEAQARTSGVARSVDFLSPSDSMAVRGVAPSVRWLKHSMLVGLVSFDATAPSYNIDVEVGLRSDGVVVWRAAR